MNRIHTSSRYRRVLAIAFASALLSAPAASARPDRDGAGTGSVQPPAQLVTADTFDWADAGIGAGSAAALLLALAGVFTRQSQSNRTFQQAPGQVS
jgi:hypothetical protein